MNAPIADIIVIGGSSGSIPVLMKILEAVPIGFAVPIVIIVHRLKNVESELAPILSSRQTVVEPEDKETIVPGCIYLAPQNYHLLVEADHSFSLDYSELVNFSRPAIDVTFSSAAEIYGKRSIAILLSGSNKDGAEGMQEVIFAGGTGIVQDPVSAEYPAMPEAAMALSPAVEVLTPTNIIKRIFYPHQNA
jgi:two-component system chemotaxis response regulator CheB